MKRGIQAAVSIRLDDQEAICTSSHLEIRGVPGIYSPRVMLVIDPSRELQSGPSLCLLDSP